MRAESIGVQPAINSTIQHRKIHLKLSNCSETAAGGGRLLFYTQKFRLKKHHQIEGMVSDFRPNFPNKLELDKDYILHRYSKTGDDYKAEVTIRFTAE